MIHSVWSDNSVYAPANKREWKSERVIAVYVQATASETTPHSLAVAHTHIQAGATSIHTPALSICAPFTASTELITPTVLWVLGLYGKQARWSQLHPTQFLVIIIRNLRWKSSFLLFSLFLFVQSQWWLIHSVHFSTYLPFFSPFVEQRLANSKAHTSRFISANLPCNKFKNRLVNIMPFESTRVCLQPIRGVEGSDYINASCIDGYRSAKDFLSWITMTLCKVLTLHL